MALNISLTDGWRIRSDAHNIILAKISGERETEQYFFSTIDSALQSFIHKKIRGFDSTSIFGLLQSIKALQTALNTALHPLELRLVPLSEADK